jgi:hypothetical protein
MSKHRSGEKRPGIDAAKASYHGYRVAKQLT